MRRFGMIAVALALLWQTFAVANMPVVSLSADEETVVICTGTGMKTVPLAQFLGIDSDQDPEQQPLGSMPSDGSCVLCLLAHHIAIASALPSIAASDLNTRAPQTPLLDAPITSGFRRAQQARAPPFNA
ncbi:hypothetical protein AXE65_01730 [Ventosimonas gracilis]|uniref:DUF2946 domain-containing protein n=2 Tax=Ventosimonas gracilis TaxID=1680762 RepID=A0A139SV55_9GAMM|nr:hypothetical protein AXE65_01730 [Ventosimonas gracilis]